MTLPSADSLLPNDELIEEKKKRFPALAAILQMLVGGVFGGTVTFGAIYMIDDISGWQALIVLVALLFSMWVQLVIHELGHMLGGLSMGMQLLALGVGRIRIERGEHGWHTRWGAKIAGIGGFASLLPKAGETFSRKTQAVYLLGGPMANLLCAALVFAVVSLFSLSDTVTVVLMVFAAVGLFIGLINLLPFYSGGFRTDGGGLIDLWRRPKLVTAYFQIQQLVAMSMAGVRPRDWPENLTPELHSAFDELRLPVSTLRMSWALDKKIHDVADEVAQVLWSHYHESKTVPLHRSYLALSISSYAAVRRADLALLQAWRPRCEGGMLDISALLAHLDAEIAHLSQSADLKQQIDDARSKLPRVHDEGSRIVLAERLDWLQSQGVN